MNTYFRLLKYAKPYKWLIPQYFIYTLLFVLFSVVNLAVLAPLLNLLFKPKQTVIETTTVEHDALSLEKFYAFLNEFISTQTKEDALYTICLILIISVILAKSLQLSYPYASSKSTNQCSHKPPKLCF